jgi:hypothetical protein
MSVGDVVRCRALDDVAARRRSTLASREPERGGSLQEASRR